MKETVKTSRTAGYLEKMFRALNQDFFDGELEEPIITIQSTPRAYGHVTVAKTWKRKDENRHELNLGAETLDRPIENTGLINNEFTIFNGIVTNVLFGIDFICTLNGDIGEYLNITFPMLTVQNPVGETTGETTAKADDQTFFPGLFRKIGGKGSLTGAGDTEIDIELERVLGVINTLE